MAAREEARRSRHSGGRARPTSMMETNFAETTLRAFAARLQLNKSNETTGSLRRLGETQPEGRKQKPKKKKLSLEAVPSPSPTASPQGSRHLLQTAGVAQCVGRGRVRRVLACVSHFTQGTDNLFAGIL